jgi:hypothetical protein
MLCLPIRFASAIGDDSKRHAQHALRDFDFPRQSADRVRREFDADVAVAFEMQVGVMVNSA